MPGKRPPEPIAPTTVPGRPTDPKIPPDQDGDLDVTPMDEDKNLEDGIEVEET